MGKHKQAQCMTCQNSTELCSINVEALENFLLKNSQEYCEKIKLGAEIYKILGKEKIEPIKKL